MTPSPRAPFSGPNISASADALSDTAAGIDSWSWSIAIAADLPLVHADDKTDFANQSELFYTGGVITLNAPSSLVDFNGNLTVADDWEMCLIRWDLNSFNYTDELRSDDGKCTSGLSDECIADLKEAVAETQRSRYRCTCQLIDSIPSCSELGDKISVFGNTCVAQPVDSESFREGYTEGKSDLVPFRDKTPHGKGDRESYDNVGSLSWPILASFMYKGEENKNGTSTFLTCVRAKDAVAGSTPPESSGSWLGVTWARIGVIFALCVLAVQI